MRRPTALHTHLPPLLLAPLPFFPPLQELGATFEETDIPADMEEICAEYREKLIDMVVELDDDAMMAYLDVSGCRRLVWEGAGGWRCEDSWWQGWSESLATFGCGVVGFGGAAACLLAPSQADLAPPCPLCLPPCLPPRLPRLQGELPDLPTIKRLIRKGTLEGKFVPVTCGTAFKNKGVQPLLDAVVDYLPAPTDLPDVKGCDVDDFEKEMTRPLTDDAPFSGLAFKIMTDPFVGSLTFVRVYSGVLEVSALPAAAGLGWAGLGGSLFVNLCGGGLQAAAAGGGG